MEDDIKYIVGGAALGAIAGALAAWAYKRYAARQAIGAPDGEAAVPAVDRGRLLRLGWAVVAVVRQVLEL